MVRRSKYMRSRSASCQNKGLCRDDNNSLQLCCFFAIFVNGGGRSDFVQAMRYMSIEFWKWSEEQPASRFSSSLQLCCFRIVSTDSENRSRCRHAFGLLFYWNRRYCFLKTTMWYNGTTVPKVVGKMRVLELWCSGGVVVEVGGAAGTYPWRPGRGST